MNKQVALAHIEKLGMKITELQSIADTPDNLAGHCDGGSRRHCPILAELQAAES